jgi:hypothetical protein
MSRRHTGPFTDLLRAAQEREHRQLAAKLGRVQWRAAARELLGYLRDDGIKADTPDDAVLIGDLRAALEDLELEADDVLDDGG